MLGAWTQNYLNEKLGDVAKNDEQRLRSGMAAHLSQSAIFISRECACVIDPGIARRAFPGLFSGDETDKRSLVSVRNLKEIGSGVFEIGEYAIFAHRYFRRSLSQVNNLNGIFLEKLYKLRDVDGLDVKIALDADRIGLADTYRTPIELEYWWGPKFDDTLVNIPVSVTCHKASERTRMFHGISGTQFWWHKQGGKHSLECEEIRDMPTFGHNNEAYGCRYVHSIVNKDTQLPDHLDGAIREYEPAAFLERLEVDISMAGKNTRYVKIWRVDGGGGLELSKWKELICDFYRDNHLPGGILIRRKTPGAD